MKLNLQKRLAAYVLGCSPKKAILDTSRLDDIKESITKADIRSLISDGAIRKAPMKGTSHSRARKLKRQKVKGRRKGRGSRSGSSNARLSTKRTWINKIRSQRELLKVLKNKGLLSSKTHSMLYTKAGGGFFRSRRHLKLYMDENRLLQQKG